MKAVILAAGYATRLYPLTRNKPKALLTINGRAILDYICDEIDTIEAVDTIVVVSNHKFYNRFMSWAFKRKGCKKIRVLDDGSTSEENRLGAIGDIKFAIDSEKLNEDIIIIAGDNFFTYKLIDFYNFFIRVKKDCIIIHETDSMDDLSRMGVVQLDRHGKVTDFEEKPLFPKTNIAVYASYIYLKSTLPMFEIYLKEGNKPDAPGHFPAWLYKKKDIMAYSFSGNCYDIGTRESLLEVRRRFENVI